jgi:hypothetical protein
MLKKLVPGKKVICFIKFKVAALEDDFCAKCGNHFQKCAILFIKKAGFAPRPLIN